MSELGNTTLEGTNSSNQGKQVNLNSDPSQSSQESTFQPINLSDYTKWTVIEVIKWCIVSLQIDENDQLCQNIRFNDITGDLLPELTLEDCENLCQDETNPQASLTKAVRLKIMINKLKDSNHEMVNCKETFQQQQENITIVLNNLYSTVNTKLQDYQSQYTQLRMDILDLVKTSDPLNDINNNNNLVRDNDESTLQPRLSRSGSRRKTHSSKPSSEHLQRRQETPTQEMSHSTSNNSLNKHVHEPTMGHNEALKQLRASKDDSSEKILKNAMRRHGLNDQDWRQYVLVIGYGDQERMLESNENPVIVFKNLKQQGLHPTIMLRRRGDFEELQSGDMLHHTDDITPGGRL